MGAYPSAPCISEGSQPVLLESNSSSSIVPVVFTWSGRAHSVYVTGSWDEWSDKDALTRTSGGEFCAVLSLPVGLYQYKFIVDGNWQHNPTLPTTTDAHGNLNNVADVKPHVPEYDVEVGEEKAPPSPRESYDFSFMPKEDVRGEPPEIPFSLGQPTSVNEALNFTRLDHLLVENIADDASSDVRSMSVMERYNDKIIQTTHIFPRNAPRPHIPISPTPAIHETYRPLQTHVYR